MPTLTRNNREPSTVKVKVLDLTPLYTECLGWLKANKPNRVNETTNLSSGWDSGYVITTNGDMYFLDRDGCGYNSPITDTGKSNAQIPIYADSSAAINGDPDVIASLTKSEILALPVKAEENLSDFIRTFGSRLESNYRDWNTLLEPIVNQEYASLMAHG